MNDLTEGYVITTNVASLRNIECDEIWLITRAGPDLEGILRVRNLAPSNELYHKYINNWRGKDPEEWWPIYTQKFQDELLTEEKRVILRNLWKLVKKGKVIALSCFCSDYRYCHRTLVGDVLRKSGLEVKELSLINKKDDETDGFEQLTIF